MAFMSNGVIHSMWKLNDGVGRQIIVSSPAGVFEANIAEVTAAETETVTANRAGSADFRTIAARHGIEFFDGDAAKTAGARST